MTEGFGAMAAGDLRRSFKATDPILPDYALERDFKAHLVKRMRHLAWRVYTHPDSRRAPHDGGFPDIVAVRAGRLLFIELKGNAGRWTEEQSQWIGDLMKVPAVSMYVWRPTHHAQIETAIAIWP